MENQTNTKSLNVLFIGDIFGSKGIEKVQQELKNIIKEHQIDFVVAQAENVSDRKGLDPNDYYLLQEIGIDVFSLGNHVWAKKSINNIIENENVIRPLNVNYSYPGKGTNVFKVKNCTIRVTTLLGITFNPLNAPWREESASNFFDAMDEIIEQDQSDFHIVDFHAETTSEKNVLALYLDGKVDALIGTHTHVQTNDARTLPKNTLFISDAGMTGPSNSAIGANFQEVYEKMRYNSMVRFKSSTNEPQFNGVVLKLKKGQKNEIFSLNLI